MQKVLQKEYKMLWEKEKLLITSNFSFFHSFFKRLVLQTDKNQGLFAKGLMTLEHRPSEKIVLSKTESINLVTLDLLSANAFDLVWTKFVSLGKKLTLSQTTNFTPFRTETVCRRQFQIL